MIQISFDRRLLPWRLFEVANLIQWKPDPFIQKIVNGWPPEFDTRKAKDLGFIQDTSMEAVIQAFIDDDLKQ